MIKGTKLWSDINPKDLFILIYLQADKFLRSNLIEQHSFANIIPFVFPNSNKEGKRVYHIAHELINSIKPQISLISFGIG